MKFLFVTHRLHSNQYDWVNTLTAKGETIRYWVWKNTSAEASVEPEIIERSSLSQLLPRFWRRPDKWFQPSSHTLVPKLRPLVKSVKDYDPDVIVVQNPHIWSIPFVVLVVARILGYATVSHVETPLYKKRGFLKRFGINLFTAFFKTKWITSILGDTANGRALHSKAFYVPIVIETSSKQSKNAPANTYDVLTIGKLSLPRKNILLLLEALLSVRKKISAQLTIVGALQSREDPTYKKIVQWINANNGKRFAEIKSNMSRNDVLNEYNNYHLFVLPSSNEPFGFSVLEAMSRGLPVLCSDSTGVQWNVRHGENGYVFKSDDLEDLTNKMISLLSDKARLRRMGEKSIELIRKNHHPDVFYKSFMKAVGRI